MAQGRSVVGFIGLGAIGSPMAERLVQAGEDVVVYNRTISKSARFRGRAKIAASPAEMADDADVVFVCLTAATLTAMSCSDRLELSAAAAQKPMSMSEPINPRSLRSLPRNFLPAASSRLMPR